MTISVYTTYRKCIYILAALIFVLISSCNEQRGYLPSSGGGAYEVELVGKNDSALDVVLHTLETPIAGLPQEEPSFDVKEGKKLNSLTKLAHTIVKININPIHAGSTSVKYEKNVSAEPQMIVIINAESLSRLKKDIPHISKGLLANLTAHQMNVQMRILKKHHNVDAEKLVKKNFGINIWVPLDMNRSKVGRNFIWLSNNSPEGMKNICIWESNTISLPDTKLSENIKGETNSMNMHTVAHFVQSKGKDKIIYRGLWEMQGDAMGGPFVEYIYLRGKKQLNCYAFVYAPEKEKRTLMRQLESSLYTIQLKYSKNGK